MLIDQIARVQRLMENRVDIENFKAVSAKQKQISIAPYVFDEMNRIIE